VSTKQTEAFLNQLSVRLVELRRKVGMTQEKLAELADIDRVALANIETGRRRPTVTTIHKIALALRIKVEDVFKGL
jgi:DNA-binding XRE family transcriptional regulator